MNILKLVSLVGWMVCSLGAVVTGCTSTPRESPWEPLPTELVVPHSLSGEWHLVRLAQSGAEPKSYERKTLTIRTDGIAYLDLWEHRLTFNFAIKDLSHIVFTEVASTNPNDKVGETYIWPFSLKEGELTLNGDVYQRQAISTPEPTVSPTSTSTGRVSAFLYQPFKLKLGQSALMLDTPENFGVLLRTVKIDSRCPKQALCASIGEAIIQIGFLRSSAQLPQMIELTTNTASPNTKVTYEGYEIQLIGLTPYPEHEFASKEINPEDYQAEFVVIRSQAEPSPTP